jgi:hydroxypyruvate isomerase
MGHLLPYAANCSLLFTEVELLARPAAARAAGFEAIEFWWPWPDQPTPPDADVDRFIAAVRDAGVRLIGLNFFAGNLAGPDCGVLSIPARSAEFRDNIEVTVGIGKALGVRGFNALYGNRVSEATPQQQDDLAAENLAVAAKAAAAIDATVLIEPVSGPKPYPLRTSSVTCFISRTTVTTSTQRWRRTGIGSRMCRSRTTLGEASPVPATWICIAISA